MKGWVDFFLINNMTFNVLLKHWLVYAALQINCHVNLTRNTQPLNAMHNFVCCLKYRFNFSVTLLDEKMHVIAADCHPRSACAPKKQRREGKPRPEKAADKTLSTAGGPFKVLEEVLWIIWHFQGPLHAYVCHSPCRDQGIQGKIQSVWILT